VTNPATPPNSPAGPPHPPAAGIQPGYPPADHAPAGWAPPSQPSPDYWAPGYLPAGYLPTAPGAPRFTPQPPPFSPQGRPLAEFGDRLLAHLIDGVIVAVAVLAVAVPAFALFIWSVPSTVQQPDLAPGEPRPVELGGGLGALALMFAAIWAVALLASLTYYVFLVRAGQTIGKRVMKIRIVHLADGSPATTFTCLKRWSIAGLCGLVPAGSYVDGLWQLWDKPFRQCLHDKAAGTTVVKVEA
jgi:uncharacterized RDD family membrane protein YckC